MNTNNNGKYQRKWPINTFPRVQYRNASILYSKKQTPISFDNNEIAKKEFHRLNPIKSEGKWSTILSGSDVVSARKRSEIGKGTYLSRQSNTINVDYFMR